MKTDTTHITIKCLKLNLTFSRETYCFTAKVYHGRSEIGFAENDGNGGCTFVCLNATGRANDFDAKAIEEKVDALVHEAAQAKDLARIIRTVRKDMNTKVLFIKAGETTEGAYSYCKHNGTVPGFDIALAAMKKKYPDAVFLNGMSDCQIAHTLGL
jgi:hypothetical protein